MGKRWIKSVYGESTSYKEMYLCHKNPYGIKWVVLQESRYGGLYADICDTGNGTEKLPAYSFLTYAKV